MARLVARNALHVRRPRSVFQQPITISAVTALRGRAARGEAKPDGFPVLFRQRAKIARFTAEHAESERIPG